MFDVGFAELFLLSLIGLIVLGPERLPAVARTIGGFMRKARASWSSLKTTIESELAEADITAPIKEATEELRRIGKDMNTDLPDFSDIPGFTAENRESPADKPDTGSESEPEPELELDPKPDSESESESEPEPEPEPQKDLFGGATASDEGKDGNV